MSTEENKAVVRRVYEDFNKGKEAVVMCPSCEPSTVLIPLGDRRDRCWPWRPWRTAITQLYLCDGCGAVLAVETPARRETGQGAGLRGGSAQRLAASAELALRTAIVHKIVVVIVVLLAFSLCGVVARSAHVPATTLRLET